MTFLQDIPNHVERQALDQLLHDILCLAVTSLSLVQAKGMLEVKRLAVELMVAPSSRSQTTVNLGRSGRVILSYEKRTGSRRRRFHVTESSPKEAIRELG